MNKRISDLLDGYEDNRVELFGDTPLSSARIKELTMKRITRKKNLLPRILGTLAAAAACVGLIFLAGLAAGVPRENGPQADVPGMGGSQGDISGTGSDTGTKSSGNIGDERPGDGCGGTLPGDFEPKLRLNGTYYRWAGLSVSSPLPYQDENGNLRLRTYLPEGFEEAGEISVISHIIEALPEELEMQAGFEASGTVYANPERPAVVYVLMTTDWFEDSYVRFTADYYQSGLIRFEGQLYWFAMGMREESEHLRALPEGCVSAGTLHIVDKDLIPANNLEINLRGDCYDHSLEGREIFRDPADDSVIYLYEEQYWREGSYPMWVECRLWTDVSDQ